MFGIKKVFDDTTFNNQNAIKQVQKILKDQFPLINQEDIDKLPDQLRNPLKYRFRSILFVTDNFRKKVEAFALLLHASDLNFCYLDFISASKNMTGRGLGSALYERVREEALLLKCKGLFFECLPDDPKLSPNEKILKQNMKRLKFYEAYGARPLINTKYETPVKEGDTDPPYLVVDALEKNTVFTKNKMRAIVQAILERKYPDVCDKKYIKMVVNSINDNPVKLRPLKYVKEDKIEQIKKVIPKEQRIIIVYNDKHAIHHIREKGYVESPVRVSNILRSLSKSNIFEIKAINRFPDNHIKAVHDTNFFNYLETVCMTVPVGESVYPYVFPIRNAAKPPRELPMRAGYYCIDTFTPLNKNAYLAARNAVDSTLTAASALLEGVYLAYALVRPPGHHAERNVFGGFCYFNSTAIAANYLSKHGRVAILDIDYHHGNGQQSIFYKRDDVLTISIHGHPSFAYPFFSGFADERGEDEGKDFNINYVLQENISNEEYIKTVAKALTKIKQFNPKYLIVAIGFDTARGDPTGTWSLDSADFNKIGHYIGDLPYPTLFVQEGGYNTRTLGKNALSFFKGVWRGSFTYD